MLLTPEENTFIKQLIALRKRKEERLQIRWNKLDEEQINCKNERQIAYQLWSESRELLVISEHPQQPLSRNELNQLLSDRRSQYAQERARAEKIDYWDRRVEQLDTEKAELVRQKSVLIKGQEKLKGVLNE
ncbi:hypothetical protein F0225_18280 [Vibrio pectenicida]|uniref:Uncharacterized protein n=1 Tax=Vibrio pectenicida TaxID=62763 RepID=A0A427U2R7_9VIBR|nr:hypothetical protein [Vibrio pectenicida]NOH73267.1 hypothetical protein [Vibrio pectenicida]RSD30956.1 hypothetical protein EJA03_11365 [Vibrio pectenicida]